VQESTEAIRMRQSAGTLRPIWVSLLRQDAKFTRFDLRNLARRNKIEKASSIAPGGPVVSLTTHGRRIESIYLTLESIARGSVLPSRIILWIDNPEHFKRRPVSLRRLENRGVEVLLTENYGPHTKYYPYLESVATCDEPLVTADDDIVYPRTWLSGLVASFRNNGNVVSCYRAHVVELVDRNVAPYLTWLPCRSSEPDVRNFATGVSGCIYPPALLAKIKAAGTKFRELCPRADDIWLHVNTIRAGFEIKQIGPWPLVFPFVPGTQADGLSISNVGLTENDFQISKTYGPGDIEILLSTAGAPLGRVEKKGGALVTGVPAI
jgi:hypothetical protein